MKHFPLFTLFAVVIYIIVAIVLHTQVNRTKINSVFGSKIDSVAGLDYTINFDSVYSDQSDVYFIMSYNWDTLTSIADDTTIYTEETEVPFSVVVKLLQLHY